MISEGRFKSEEQQIEGKKGTDQNGTYLSPNILM